MTHAPCHVHAIDELLSTVTAFRSDADAASGLLAPTGTRGTVSKPVCVLFAAR